MTRRAAALLASGRPSAVEFNAHRIHDLFDVAAMFPDLELVEFSGVDDAGRLGFDRDLKELRSAR